MIALDEARARLLALVPDPQQRLEQTPVQQAAGRVLLQGITALRTQPARDLSAMDGYAVRGAWPWRQIGESAAGRAFDGALAEGECVRIFTGAVVPKGGEAVIMQEDVARDGGVIALAADLEIRPGKHIRAQGSDFQNGQQLLEAGALLTPARLALAISGGHGSVPLARPVRVAILSTGDELRAPGTVCADDQIPASNGVMLAALLAQPGVLIDDLGLVADTMEAMKEALARAQGADVLITIGGASVGDHDLVKPALEAAGAHLDFWKVAMKPGKPLMAGKLGDTLVLGLPGNPASAYVTAFLFALPVLRAMLGWQEPHHEPVEIPSGADIPANGPRTDHLRAQADGQQVKPLGLNDSAALVALSAANALIVRDAHAKAVAAGEKVPVLLLS